MAASQEPLAGTRGPGVEAPVRTPLRDAWSSFVKNKVALSSVVFVALLVVVALFADNSLVVLALRPFGYDGEVRSLLAPRPFDEVNFEAANTDPNREFPLGADSLGRDILSRTIYGTRVSLSVALAAATTSLLVGLTYGLISGYAGGRVDEFMMRLVDYFYAFPTLILVVLLQVYLNALARRGGSGIVGAMIALNDASGGLLFIFIALGLLNWLGMARIARGLVLSVKSREFIEAARANGASDGRIIFGHILPNILGQCVVAETLQIPGYILTEAFLSFLGLGVQPPTPSWGIMISDTYQGLRAHPALLIGPSLALTLTTLAFNFLGDGLRDALDPRQRGA